jgi:probable phosphoglycerate mutase
MARLLLVRHAPTAETGTRLTGRLPGVSLTEEGRLAAKRLAERLADHRVAAVFTSPLARTAETAAEIAAVHRLQPVVDERLLEVDYGKWAGRTLTSLRRLKAWRTVMVAPSRMRFPEGESLLEAQTRAVSACEDIAARKGTVVAVTHADIIKAVVSHYLGQPLDLFQRIGVAPTSVTVLELSKGGVPVVLAVNTPGILP